MYLPPGYEYFVCQHCYELTYTSCQESHLFNSLYASMAGFMNESIPGFSFGNANKTLGNLENRWRDEGINEINFRMLAEIEKQEEKKKERLSKYLSAYDLCRRSGLSEDELEKLGEYRLLVSDTKEGKYRPKLVGWGKKLKEKLPNGCPP